jgi:hypothetical protein
MADDFLNYAFEYWLKKGYAPHQAAALAGQAQWESGGNPTAVGDSGTAFGSFQWRGDRRQRLNATADPKSIPGQLDFANWELSNTEKGAGDALRNAKDYTEATNAVLGYLRPQGYTAKNPAGSHGYADRYNIGANLLNQPQMAQVLAMPPTQQVASAVPADVVAATTPPEDLRTKDDRDMGGYGGSPKLPDANSKPFNFGGLLAAGMGQVAAGEGAPVEQPAWIKQAMSGGQAQAHRPQVPAGLLTDIFNTNDDEERRRRKMAGLLGEL